jgi:hypothetical protein
MLFRTAMYASTRWSSAFAWGWLSWISQTWSRSVSIRSIFWDFKIGEKWKATARGFGSSMMLGKLSSVIGSAMVLSPFRLGGGAYGERGPWVGGSSFTLGWFFLVPSVD